MFLALEMNFVWSKIINHVSNYFSISWVKMHFKWLEKFRLIISIVVILKIWVLFNVKSVCQKVVKMLLAQMAVLNSYFSVFIVKFRYSEKATKIWHIFHYLFGTSDNFEMFVESSISSMKRTKTLVNISKNEFIHSFFGRIHGFTIISGRWDKYLLPS